MNIGTLTATLLFITLIGLVVGLFMHEFRKLRRKSSHNNKYC